MNNATTLQPLQPIDFYPRIEAAELLDFRLTRLGGTLDQYVHPSHGSIFVKTGEGRARIDLLQEHQAAGVLKGHLPISEEIAFFDDGEEAIVVTRTVEGSPAHRAFTSLEREDLVEFLLQALTLVWGAPTRLGPQLPRNTARAIADAKQLLAEPAFDRNHFERETLLAPEAVLLECEALLVSTQEEVISHGDFFLPNLIVSADHKPVFLDLGKAGLADKARDMASLRASLRRHVDDEAFFEVAHRIGFDVAANERRMEVYRLLDYFEYALKW